jgi:hypothetical protein
MKSLQIKYVIQGVCLAAMFVFFSQTYAQETDTLSIININNAVDSLTNNISVNDSSLSDSAAQEISGKPKQKLELKPLWYDIQGNIQNTTDSSKFTIFYYDDILHQNYHGFADVFRNQSMYQVYDFLDMGQPRFIAGFNLLPHQTSFQLDGRNANDPIHGMYNTRFICLDIIQSVETNSYQANPIINQPNIFNGINVTTRTINPDDPYTRIMFRQGDFGYTDLDITFAQKISDNMTLQLGGINKLYDHNGYKGVNYRGGFSYRISPKMYSRLRFNLNREKLMMYNYGTGFIHHYKEARDDVYNDLTYIVDEDKKEQWHIQAAVSRSERTVKSNSDSFHVCNQYYQAQIGLNRNWNFSRFEIAAGLSGFQYKVWGEAFGTKYVDPGFNSPIIINCPLNQYMLISPETKTGYLNEYVDSGFNSTLKINYALNQYIVISPEIKTAYLNGFDLNLLPGLEMRWQSGQITARIFALHSNRFPNRTERSYNYLEYRGNNDLTCEKSTSLTASFKYQPSTKFSLFGETGSRVIKDEIVFENNTFKNDKDRSFNYFSANARYQFYKFSILGGGQISDASINISPAKSVWLQGRYHDVWLKGAVIIDAVGSVHWYDQHNKIIYNPIVERFYWTDKKYDSYYLLSYKITATVKDAQLFIEMDNPLSNEYRYISGYYELYRRIRVGLNWVLWD